MNAKSTKSLLLNLSLALPLCLATGCVAVALAGAGVGGYAFYKGELKTTESASLDRLWQATRQAVSKLQLSVTEELKDGLSASLKATSADGRPISIKLRRITDRTTEMRIRSGHIGNEDQARQIRDAIKEQL